MKVAIFSLLLTATAVADATNCDVDVLTKLSETSDALQCKDVSNFAVPVESTSNTVITDLGYFCANGACVRLLKPLGDINECSIDGSGLHTVVVGPIDALCRTTRTLRAADGSDVHSSGMDMGSASAETRNSHEVTSPTTSSEAEDSHDTTSASSGAEDSHDVAASASASASAAAGDDDDGDSHDTASSSATSKSTSTSSTAGSKATSSNSTSSTQAPSASGTSSAASFTVAAGSVFLAAAAAFF